MKVNVNPYGNLDLENDPLYIKDGDYRDALDITPISDGNGNTLSIEPVIGNIQVCDLSVQAVQSKSVRFYLALGSSDYEFDFRRPNGTSMLTVIVNQDPNGTTMINNAVTDILTAFNGAGFTSTLANGNIPGLYVDVSNIDPYGWEWFANNIGNQVAQIQTVAEAVDVGASGPFEEIGSFDLSGDLFKWSATRAGLSSDLPITLAEEDAGEIILTIPNHGLVDGEAIFIAGVTNNGVSMDGEWIALEVLNPSGERDANKVRLYQSTHVGPYVLTSAVATIGAYSVGQIGVVQQDVMTDNPFGEFTYFSLIKTKAFDFRISKRVDTAIEPDINKKSFYFTDGRSDIRALYYKGAYQNDGFLNTTNAYTYETIGDESRLLVSDSDVDVTFAGEIHGGGNVVSGNHAFSVCLVTESGVETDYTDLTGNINVFSAIPNFGSNDNLLKGDPDGTLTTKQIKLDIIGLDITLFKYVKLVDVQFSGGARAGFEVGRYLITGSTISIVYTGFEALAPFDLGLLSRITPNIKTAEHLRIMDKRLFIGNLTGEEIRDFSGFFATFTHALLMGNIPTIGTTTTIDPTTFNIPANAFEEYFKPENVNAKMGYMINETYRLMGGVKLKSGYRFPLRWHIDDICIDTNPVNTGNVFPGYVNRRTAGLPLYSLSSGADINIPHIEFGGFDLNFIVDGKRVKDLVDEIFIEVVPMDEKYQEVLASGFSFACVHGQSTYTTIPPGVGQTTTGAEIGVNAGAAILPNKVIEWWNPFNIAQFVPSGNYTALPAGATAEPNIVSFYAPDCYLGGKQITFSPGDEVITFDDVTLALLTFTIGNAAVAANGLLFNDVYAQYPNLVGNADAIGPNRYTLDDVKFVGRGQDTNAFAATAKTFTKRLFIQYSPDNGSGATTTQRWQFAQGYALHSASSILPPGGFDRGVFYSQYYRSKGKGAKFGPIETTTSVPTGASFEITAATNPLGNTIEVFGGDVFSQNTYFKALYPENSAVNPVSAPISFSGYGIGFRIETQNRINVQMKYVAGSPTVPEISADAWLTSNIDDPMTYSHSYDDNKGVVVHQAFDSTIPREVATYPTRIMYSDTNPNNSITDLHRKFQVLNFRDIDQIYGPISGMEVCNGELVTFQPRKYQRQYVNSAGVLLSSSGSEVILGDGGVLQRRGLDISSVGCKHKWSIIKGLSKGGADVLAWINTEFGFIMRFGYDGTNPISVVHHVKGFIDKNTLYANERTSSRDESIHGVFNIRRDEFIWSVRARKTTDEEFTPGKIYFNGDTVYHFDGTSQFPRIYKALINTNKVTGNFFTQAAVVTPYVMDAAADITETNYWEEKTDPLLRNEFTLTFNETKNGFASKYTPCPRIYGAWKSGYTSPSPFDPQLVFVHNRGEIAGWYPNPLPKLVSTPYIQMVVNKQPDEKKDYDAAELNNELIPNNANMPGVPLLVFETEQHESFLFPDEFELGEEQDIGYASPIKNDSTVDPVSNPLGVNDADTSSLFGRHLLVKYNFSRTVYDKLFGLVIKLSTRARSNRT